MIYKMYLCKPIDPKEALLDWRYYAPNDGIFNFDGKLEILAEIMVHNSKQKGYVEEILTGIKIPSLYVVVERQDGDYKRKYCFDLEGKLKEGIYAFGIKKKVSIKDEIENKFYQNRATIEEIFEYEEKHKDIHVWTHFLLENLEEEKRIAQMILKEKRKDEIKNVKENVRKLIKGK